MSSTNTILIYGRDHSLLETRGWVLELAGYRVCLAMELDEVVRVLTAQSVILLLLCHSLSPEDCEEVLSVTEQLRPGLRKLLVTANTVVATSATKERTVSAFDGPRAMIAAVEGVLSTKDDAGDRAK